MFYIVALMVPLVMRFFFELERQVDILRAALGDEVDAAACPAAVLLLTDDAVIRVLEAATALVKAGEAVRIAAAGVAAGRSPRAAGHQGLAQTRGHRSPVALVQEITGSTRADAAKHVRLGQALLHAGLVDAESRIDSAAASPTDSEIPGTPSIPGSERPWHAALSDAMMRGTITSTQQDVILRGLGEPPSCDTPAACVGDDGARTDGDVCNEHRGASARHAWAAAAEQLIDEASTRTAEELGKAARTIRDMLDPEGAQRRFDERFEGRSFHTWTDGDGIHHGSIRFDDLGHAWLRAVQDTALRPRRGGPRFVDPDEKAKADELAADPRTNDQLAYDLLLDTLRAGSLADAATVFGTRQAGVRVIITADALRRADGSTRDTERSADDLGADAGIAVLEEGGTLPAWLARQQACSIGSVECALDGSGNPLYLGREVRTFSSKQNIALAIRDGGCRWPGCDRPPAYGEAHHIDRWVDGGRTDIDRGILLCRFHHMNLHHGGWRITRHGPGPFLLHPPRGADPIVLGTPIERRYVYGDLQPPPLRFRPAA
ncbi:HNH endonuclease signature motif containing protein [Microbacterium rhizosphaerae]|uniref:DUF222 domain-containing protein n=3 Tax=Microbacterium rhizosphaerae TaxID=1678237 RepID=A0ABZ0SQU9_9MICO|nr:DUF222 domain-containing protein [Microbacterium rhizosphaerae]WPR89602.1 DUF222 domain-containing protein [Microbacterium rhizosphaerae]